MKRICVFCGSSPGVHPAYAESAKWLGRILAKKKTGLVYGGGSVGLMGILAQSVLKCGGRVTGIIPRLLVERELALEGLEDLRIVNSMHERKALMAELSDGFIALPGGIGTIEEFVEILTWTQLGIHDKPCGLLNIEGYYNSFLVFFDHMIGEGFIPPENREILLVDEDPIALLIKMENYRSPRVDKAGWALKLSNG